MAKENQIKIAFENKTLTETYGKFTMQPLERGYGTTLGNECDVLL